MSPCTICSSFTDEQLAEITHRKRYSKKSDKNKAEDIDSELLGDNSSESYGGSHAELEVAANRLFTSPPRPQPLSFEALSLRTPARTVPPTPGTALQQKVQANLEKSLSSCLDIQMDEKMGAFQASMLEAFNSLREDFQKSLQKQGEVDQTSSASKMNAPSKDIAKPSQSSSALESMEVEYGPDLPPRLDSYSSGLEDDSAQVRSSGEEPLKVASTKQKNLHTLLGIRSWIRALPQTTTQTTLVTLSRPLGPKSTLINQKTSRGPDFYHHLQRRISPLNIGIGPLSPLGSHTLIRTTPNMTLTLLITGK